MDDRQIIIRDSVFGDSDGGVMAPVCATPSVGLSKGGSIGEVHAALRMICLIQNRKSRVNLMTKARFSRNGVPRSDVSRWSL